MKLFSLAHTEQEVDYTIEKMPASILRR